MLRSVDEAVGALIARLASEGVLDETYIIFASDNGFFRGEHRIAGGKFLAYDPSSKIPLMIRGPGIPAGTVSDELVSELDITQTIVEIATGVVEPEPRRALAHPLRAGRHPPIDPPDPARGRHRPR